MSTFPDFVEHVAAGARRVGAFLSPGAAANLGDLDDRALADIGVARSEIDSIEAESRSSSWPTRRRIVVVPRHA